MKSLILTKVACILSFVLWASLAFAQPVIRVAGSKDPQLIKKQVEMLLNHLNIQENVYLTVFISGNVPEKLKGITISDPSPEPDKYQVIRVLIDAGLNIRQQMLVLAHEMIHVKQYAKMELKIVGDQKVIWKEKEYLLSRVNNRYLPWEDEAYHADFNLARLVKTSHNEFEVVLAEKVPNPTVNTTSRCIYWSGKCTIKSGNDSLIVKSPNS